MQKQDFNLRKVDDRIPILQLAIPGAINIKKPRYESRKMVLNQAQQYANKR